MRTASVLVCAFMGIVFVLLTVASSASVASAPGAPLPLEADGAPTGDHLGPITCGKGGRCHGSPNPDRETSGNAPERFTSFDEFTVWKNRDHAHRFAFRTLSSPRSRQIMINLGADPESGREDPRCLACHAIPAPTYDENLLDHSRWGVSCESCHGPARKWLTEHTTRGSDYWRVPMADRQDRYGKWPTHDVIDRARLCAGCHIGAPADETSALRDAHHEIMAAGHPRLTFEMSGYHEDMATHWVERRPNDGRTFDVRLWAVGQVVTTQAALDLLADRASRGGAWPEFAEYDCYSCHHDLGGGAWRHGEKNFRGRTPGSLPWGDWYRATWVIAGDLPVPGGPAATMAGLLDELEAEMMKPRPDRQRCQEMARNGSKVLGRWLEERRNQPRQFDPETMKLWLTRLAADDDGLAARSWDSAHQLAQAMHAIYQSLPASEQNPKLGETIERIRERMQRPRKRDRSRESPWDFGPDALRALLEEAQEALDR